MEAARLVLDETLPPFSFEIRGKPHDEPSCFQVWTTFDLRQRVKPANDHPDFDMWQFNRTAGAEKFFDYDWDFAVPRQGMWVDYGFKAFHKDQCDRKQQWAFFKAHSPEALKRLMDLDFGAIAHSGSKMPGFGKADIVAAYEGMLKAA